MRWIWDADKNRSNQRKHGLRFETAALVFDDPLAASRRDPHQDEERWQTVGLVGPVVIFVVHTCAGPDPEMGRKVAASSAPERRPPMSEGSMKKATSEDSTEAQAMELAALAAMPDDRIDTRDIPEQTDWSGARRGAFFRPIKQQLTLRLDVDLVAWFKAQAPAGEGYQTRINDALRTYVAERSGPATQS